MCTDTALGCRDGLNTSMPDVFTIRQSHSVEVIETRVRVADSVITHSLKFAIKEKAIHCLNQKFSK